VIARTSDLKTMAEMFVTVLEFARYEPDNFIFGPFDEKMLLENGMVVDPVPPLLADQLRERFPSVEFSDG